MKITITEKEIKALENASTWLGLLAERDADDDGGHAGLVADKRGIDRILAKVRASLLNTEAREPEPSGHDRRPGAVEGSL